MKTPALGINPKVQRDTRATRSDRLRLFLRTYATVIGLLGLVLVFGALKPTIFLTIVNLRNILVGVAVTAVAATGQTCVFALNDFDMSMGSTSSMTGMITGVLMVNQHLPWPLAVVVGLGIGCAAGCINGPTTPRRRRARPSATWPLS